MPKFSSAAIDVRDFWEKKILVWERGRYDSKKQNQGSLENIANRASDSLRYRLKIATELLTPHVTGKRVVELGCGSGLLAGKFIDAGALSFTGYDIAEGAISRAKEHYAGGPYEKNVHFITADLNKLDSLDADIVFSLGLLDWLSDLEILHLFKISGQAHFLHAISEKRFSLSLFLHKIYCYVSYGYRTRGYVPRYVSPGEMFALVGDSAGGRDFYVYRDPKLSFGALLSSLPVGNRHRDS